MTNPLQPLDPAGAPSPITPADTPSDAAGYAMVTPSGRGPAGYDIQAPMPDTETPFAAANALNGPRQAQTETMLSSPPGFAAGGYDIPAGWSGGGGDSGWPNDPRPAAVSTPDQGTGDFTGTGTD